MFVYAVIEYFWGDGDEGRFAFCSFVAIFTIPMLAGSILILYRRRLGLRQLRFGAILLVCEPGSLLRILTLEEDLRYIAYMNRMIPPK